MSEDRNPMIGREIATGMCAHGYPIGFGTCPYCASPEREPEMAPDVPEPDAKES